MTPDYYTLLGVSRGAEAEIIRAAYLALARRYHPDAATAASPHDAEKFRLITEAYEVLRDPRRREYYDWGHSRQEQNLDEPEQWARPREEQTHRDVRAPAKIRWSSALANPLVYSAGAIALVVALVFRTRQGDSPRRPLRRHRSGNAHGEIRAVVERNER